MGKRTNRVAWWLVVLTAMALGGMGGPSLWLRAY
jgi:hypothetical protein